MYTAPEYAGQGIGSALLGRLEWLMRERGVDAVRVEASPNALSFYLRRGLRGERSTNAGWRLADRKAAFGLKSGPRIA